MLKIAYTEIYQHSLPEDHRFPMLKYELIPKQLLYEGIITAQNLFEPKLCTEENILLTHDFDYWQRMKNLELTEREMRKVGFPLSAQLVEREITIMQGTIDCALFALQFGCAMNVAGGTHHAFTNKGEGFCLLNDMAIAANYLLKNKLAERILIVDLDVHQGNGTAQIFQDNKNVFTLSMHGKNNYPFHKEISDLDIELPDGINDADYLELLYQNLPKIIKSHQPDFIFYLCGVDILATDKFGKLNVSTEGCLQRDTFVFEQCKVNKIPVSCAMGGGYSPKIADIVNAHTNTFKAAINLFD
ncbi:MAG: histone deacetylase [Bacteroidia bacterium]|nr:histone deacetylase [Bacteroidia bacterium]